MVTALTGHAAPATLWTLALMLAAGEILWPSLGRRDLFPGGLLLFAPLLLLRFSSVADFEVRLLTFTALALLISLARHPRPARLRVSFLGWRAPARWLLAWAILAAASLVMTSQSVWLSGDEPHYVMLAQSLVEDHDFDVRNNLQGNTYREFHPVELEFHGSVHGEGFYLFHLPGLSFFLAPFYLLWKLLGMPLAAPLYFRLVAALIGATFALLLFRALRTLLPDIDPSPGWLLSIATFPLLFHGTHLYPEIPAATLTLGAFLLMTGERRRPLLAGLLLALVPWFHIKYTLAVAILGLWMAWRTLRDRDLPGLLRLAAAPLFSALMLAGYSKLLYGSFSPDAIFPHGDYWGVPLMLRVETFLALLFDQRDGLLLYAPLILLLPLALSRSPLPYRGLLTTLLLAYLASHAFTTVRGAYSPAGRPVMFALWALLLLLTAFFQAHRDDGWGRFARLLASFGILASVILLVHPLFAYQPVTQATGEGASSLLLFLGSDRLPLQHLFPSFLKIPFAPKNPANLIWLLSLAGLLLYFRLRPRAGRPGAGHPGVTVLVFLSAVGLTCLFPHLHLSRSQRLLAGNQTLYSPSRNVAPLGEGRFRVRSGNRYDLFLAATPLASGPAVLTFETLPAGVRLSSGRKILLCSSGGESSLRLDRQALHGIAGTQPAVVHLGLDLRALPPAQFLFFSLSSLR